MGNFLWVRLETRVDRKEKSLALQLVQSILPKKTKVLISYRFFQDDPFSAPILDSIMSSMVGCHAFYNHDCAGNDDRIVASLDLQRTFNMVTANGLLWLKDGWSWLDMSAQKDGRAVADAAQNTAGVVGFLGNLSILYAKGIVVFGAFAGRNLDAVTDFNSFDCTDGHDR